MFDPLSGAQSPLDLSSAMSGESEFKSTDILPDAEGDSVYRFQEWKYKRPDILKKYTTNAAIPVVANFLEDKVMQGVPKVILPNMSFNLRFFNKCF